MGETYEQMKCYLIHSFRSFLQMLQRSGCLEDTNFQLPVWLLPLMRSSSSLLPKTAPLLSVGLQSHCMKNLVIELAASVHWAFLFLQGMLRVARKCIRYLVVGKVQRIDMLDIQLISCVWPYHLMENTWWVDVTDCKVFVFSLQGPYCIVTAR